MAAKIKRDFHFFGGVYLENQLQIDFFTVTSYMEIFTTNPDEQAIVFDRLKYLYKTKLDNCIFLNQNDKKVIDLFGQMPGVKISTLPTDPYDQALAIVLLHKMNAISEGRLVISKLNFKSHLSEGVEYLIDLYEPHGQFDSKNNWWHNAGANVSNKITPTKEKIVQLDKIISDWTNLGMGWSRKPKVENQIKFLLDTEKT